jgi:hypothetical protein
MFRTRLGPYLHRKHMDSTHCARQASYCTETSALPFPITIGVHPRYSPAKNPSSRKMVLYPWKAVLYGRLPVMLLCAWNRTCRAADLVYDAQPRHVDV